MEKEALAIRNQKVFVRLSQVTELAEKYTNLCNDIKAQRAKGAEVRDMLFRKATYDLIIRTLELPIQEQRL